MTGTESDTREREALETIVGLQESGTLDDLVELAGLASLATDALDDEMVTSLAGTGSDIGELADAASDPDTRRGIERTLASVGTAERTDVEPVGAVGLVRALRDPDVQAGLGYLVAVAGALGESRQSD